MRSFDVVVIGAGQAASPLMERLTRAGRTVAVIEREDPGGSCVRFGCTPSKAVLASAGLLARSRRAAEFGLSGALAGDLPGVLAAAREIVRRSVEKVTAEFEGDNPLLLRGEGRIVGGADGAFEVAVGGETVRAGKVVLNLGSRTVMPEIEGLEDPITAENWLERDGVGPRLAIVGAGAIGLEMATFYTAFGREVTLYDPAERILPHEHGETAVLLRERMEARGIRFALGRKVERRDEMDADDVFVAPGRKPALDGFEVATDERGFVRVDGRLRTSVPGIYAAGDLRGGPMLTSTAWDDGRVIAADLLDEPTRGTRRLVPTTLYTDPPFASVGSWDGEARTFDLARNGRADTERTTEGRVTWFVEDGALRGCAIVGGEACEMIAAAQVAVAAGWSVETFADLVTAHPTWMEGLQSALL